MRSDCGECAEQFGMYERFRMLPIKQAASISYNSMEAG